MLVLSRKQNESVVVTSPGGGGCLITVTVVEIRGGRVRLGFEAADDIPINRSEVWKQKHAGDQQTDHPQTRGVAPKETMARWEDDGGEAAGPSESPIVSRKNGFRRQRRRLDLPPRT